jgi:uncharacterized protein (TIGR03435 family)
VLKLLSIVACVAAFTAKLAFAQVPGDLGNRFARAAITGNDKPLLMGTIFKDTADNLVVMGAPLADVIARAYGVEPYQVVGAPDWVYAAHLYDIEAVPPPANLVKSDDTRMLRALLADRFGLRVYRGTHEVTMTVLEADPAIQLGMRIRAIPAEVGYYASRRIVNTLTLGGPRARFMMKQLPVVAVNQNNRTLLNTRGLVASLMRAIREPVLDLTGLGVVHLVDALAVRTLPQNLEQMTDVLEQSGLSFERRTVRMNVLVVTNVEHPRLDLIDR